MDNERAPSNDAAVVAPTGDMDLAIADRMRGTLTDGVEAGRVRLVVDLAAVGDNDGSGMGALVAALEHPRARGGDFRRAARQNDGRATFELTRRHGAIAIEPTRLQAVASR
jgi:anti-anti-sigma factor